MRLFNGLHVIEILNQIFSVVVGSGLILIYLYFEDI